MFITESSLSVLGSSRSPEPDTRYSGVAGCELAIMENEINNYSLFKMHVASDAHEIGMIREGASSDEIHYFIEGALSDLWDKIKEFIKKIWAKLKAILTGFIARLEAFMGKNGYEFYKKYEKILHNGVHLKDVKTKYRRPLNYDAEIKEIDLAKVLNVHYGIDLSNDTKLNISKDVDMDDLKDDMLKIITNDKLDDFKNLKKELREKMFEDEEEIELEDSKVSEYIAFITGKKSVVDKFKKMKDSVDKQFSLWDKDIENVRKKIAERIKADGSAGGDTKAYTDLTDNKIISKSKITLTSDKSKATFDRDTIDKRDPDKNPKYSQQTVNAIQQTVNAGSNVWSSYSSAYMENCKFAVAQSRRIAAIIVAYRSRHKNESSLIDLSVPESDIYYQAIGEAAEWEVMSELEDNVPVYY